MSNQEVILLRVIRFHASMVHYLRVNDISITCKGIGNKDKHDVFLLIRILATDDSLTGFLQIGKSKNDSGHVLTLLVVSPRDDD